MSVISVGQVWRCKTGNYPTLPWLNTVLVLGVCPSWEGEDHWFVLDLDTGETTVSVSLADPYNSHLFWERVS